MWSEEDILRVLDDCGRRFTFPTLDNGYAHWRHWPEGGTL